MGEILDALHRLQSVEVKLAKIRQAGEARSRRVELHGRHARQFEEKLEQLKGVIRDHQIRIDALTLEMTTREETTVKQRVELSKAKTNKQYSAILEVINTTKADNAKLESTILELMESVQRLNEEAAQVENEKKEQIDRVATAERALAAQAEETDPERRRLESERDKHAQHLSPQALATFQRVAQRHDGEAMVPVVKLNPRREEYACSGCNMKTTLEVVNALQSHDSMLFCPICGRILYYDDAVVSRR